MGLRVLPPQAHAGGLSDETVHELARDAAPLGCVVARGGVVIMRPGLIHASSKSHSEALRPGLHVGYAAS